jgi:hypothetical protein
MALNLRQLASGMFSRVLLNSNFEKIENKVNDDLVHRQNGSAQMQQDLDMNSNQILNVADPVIDLDVATKRYVDNSHVDVQAQIAANLSAIQNIEASGTIRQESEEFVATQGQTVFTLTTTTFAGEDTLAVYVNGVRQSHSAYTTSSTNVITFSEGLQDGDKVIFTVNESTSTTLTASQISGLTVDTVANLASAEHRTGSLQLLGFHTKGDGGGGVFYWDATKDKSEHNGGTIIDPDKAGLVTNWASTQALYFLPEVTGTGCWVREFSGAVNVKWFGFYEETAVNLKKCPISDNVFCTTKGYYNENDGGGASYKIVAKDEEKITAGIQLETANGFAAELLNFEDVDVAQIGAINSSTQDVATILQPYINYFKNTSLKGLRLRFGLTTYYLHTTLEILNFGGNTSITLEGVAKSKINSKGTGSILYGNTGGIAVLIAGSENVNIKNITVLNDPNSSQPSNVGIMLARSSTKPYCQFINFENLHINITSNNQSVNSGKGGIGVYNYASETHSWSDVSIKADTPLVLTTTNMCNINYTDYFDNTGTESQYTTTNFSYNHLQLYPVTNSALILDIVRDLSIDTLLTYATSALAKYSIEFYGILPNRRIYIKNIHSENIRRGFRVDNPLYESSFSGKLGHTATDKMALVLNTGLLNNVVFDCFTYGNGTVQMIDDISSNESFNVTVKNSKKTNSTDVVTSYTLGSAVYNELHIYNDNLWSTINSSITSIASNIIYIHGTNGLYKRGTFFRGTTASRPSSDAYVGKEYFDTTLGKVIWWNGSNWVDSTGTAV